MAPDGALYVDEITVATVDVDRDMNDARLLEELDNLRAAMFAGYSSVDSPQLEVWVTVHPLYGVA